jgi:ribosomal protein S18 acetylase RimI-like enzyme
VIVPEAASATFTIRRLAPADATAYRALRLRALREHPEAFRSSHEQEAARTDDWAARRLGADGDTVMLGAFSNVTLLIGAVGLTLQDRPKVRHAGQLVGMYVAPEHARRGAGRALLAAGLEHARSLAHLELLLLAVTRSNQRARRMYRAAGFVEYGHEPRSLKVGNRYFDTTLMALDLRPARAPA